MCIFDILIDWFYMNAHTNLLHWDTLLFIYNLIYFIDNGISLLKNNIVLYSTNIFFSFFLICAECHVQKWQHCNKLYDWCLATVYSRFGISSARCEPPDVCSLSQPAVPLESWSYLINMIISTSQFNYI